jgi:DnaJ family protein C protein 19
MTTPIVAGFGVAAVAMTGRMAILAFEAWKTAPPRTRRFYEGGFEPEMTRREAALILGVRESAAKDKVLAAHRKVMIANHPDAGGSDYIATKINEAKAQLLGGRGGKTPF